MNRFLAWCAAVSCAWFGVLLFGPGPAAASAPAVAAWWSATSTSVAAAPPPPDVKADDLFVQGSNVAPVGVVPAVMGPPSAQAVAAVAFSVPTGVRVGTLVLPLDPDADAPPAVSVMACRVTKPFKAVHNGPYDEVPPYDEAACVPGELSSDGKSLSFANVSRLVRSDALMLALVPGPLDRVVLAPPPPTALTLTAPVARPQPFGPSSTAEPAAVPAGAAPVVPSQQDAVGPGLAAPTQPDAPSPAPVLAPAVATAPTSDVPRSAAHRATAGRTDARVLAAIGLAGLAGFALLGGIRTRAPAGDGTEIGVGRFRSTRIGKAPRIS